MILKFIKYITRLDKGKIKKNVCNEVFGNECQVFEINLICVSTYSNKIIG